LVGRKYRVWPARVLVVRGGDDAVRDGVGGAAAEEPSEGRFGTCFALAGEDRANRAGDRAAGVSCGRSQASESDVFDGAEVLATLTRWTGSGERWAKSIAALVDAASEQTNVTEGVVLEAIHAVWERCLALGWA